MMKLFKSLVAGFMVFYGLNSFAEGVNQLIANKFIDEYKNQIGITNNELVSMQTIESGKNFIAKNQQNEIQKLSKFDIGGTNLKDLVRETEKFNNNIWLINQSSNALDKIVKNLKLVDDDKVQNFVDETGIVNKLNKVKDVRKDLSLSWSKLGTNFQESAERLYNASGTGWNISRKTFLSLDKKFKKIVGLEKALKAKNTVVLLELLTNLGKATYNNKTEDKASFHTNVINSFNIVAKELKKLGYDENSKIGKTGYALEIATNAINLINNLNDLKKINDIDESLFSTESAIHLNIKKQEISNNLVNNSLSLISSIAGDADVLEISGISSEITNAYVDVQTITNKYAANFDNKVKKEENNRLDLVLADVSKIQKFVKEELGNGILNNDLDLERKLGFTGAKERGIEKQKESDKKLAEIEKELEEQEKEQEKLLKKQKLAEKIKEKIAKEKQAKQEKEQVKIENDKIAKQEKITTKKNQAQDLKDKNTQLIAKYKVLNLEYVKNPSALNKQKLDNLGADLNKNAREFVAIRGEILALDNNLTKNDIGFVDDTQITITKINKNNPNLSEQLAINKDDRSQKLKEIKAKILANYNEKQQVKQQLESQGEMISYIQNAKNKGSDNISDVEKVRLQILAKSFGAKDFTFLFKNIDTLARTNQQNLNKLNTEQFNIDEFLQHGIGAITDDNKFNDFLAGIGDDVLTDFNDDIKDDVEDDSKNDKNELGVIEGHFSYIGIHQNGGDTYSIGDLSTKDNNNTFDAIEYLDLSNSGVSGGYPEITPSTPSQRYPDIDGYKYTAWGNWSKSGLVADIGGQNYIVNYGHYIIGNEAREIPNTGNATYNGSLLGSTVGISNNGVVEKNSIGGNIEINVDFQNSSLNAILTTTKNNSNWAIARFKNLSIQNNYFRSGFNGTVDGGGTSRINGQFFGTNAQEVGGVFQISKSGNDADNATGVFRAKQ